jgi:hypothetical protein
MGAHVSQAPNRRVGVAAEAMSCRSEGMALLRSRRVHGDPKKKNPSNVCTKSNIELLECRSRRSK